MRGYDDRSYGDGFADVYDDWYADVTDVDATVGRMLALAGPDGRVLELGVGTGRLALPMAAAGLQVVGVDTSAAMLERLAERDPAGLIDVVCGDMVDDLPDGPFDAALVAYNTIFNLLDEQRQLACFAAVAERLAPGGSFVVEAFVPDVEVATGDRLRCLRAIARRRPGRALGVGRTTPTISAPRVSSSSSPRRAVCDCGRGRSAGPRPNSSTPWRHRPGCGSSIAAATCPAPPSPTTAPTTCRSTSAPP